MFLTKLRMIKKRLRVFTRFNTRSLIANKRLYLYYFVLNHLSLL